jgi:hypothetical protein
VSKEEVQLDIGTNQSRMNDEYGSGQSGCMAARGGRFTNSLWRLRWQPAADGSHEGQDRNLKNPGPSVLRIVFLRKSS